MEQGAESQQSPSQMSPDAQAILLCTAAFGRFGGEYDALSLEEWVELAEWLRAHAQSPKTLLEPERLDHLENLGLESKLDMLRLRHLLGRGVEMGLTRNKWERAGLWTLTRADADYPATITRSLGRWRPPVLYGCGNMELLHRPGLALIEPRTGPAAPQPLASVLVARALQHGLPLVADGQAGPSRMLLDAAAEHGASGTLVFQQGILKHAISSRFRNLIMAGNLLLLSAADPEARRHGLRRPAVLDAGSLAVASIAVADKSLDLAAALLQEEDRPAPSTQDPGHKADLAELGQETVVPSVHEETGRPAGQDAELRTDRPLEASTDQPGSPVSVPERFYALFLDALAEVTANDPLPSAEISKQTGIGKRLVDEWLKRGRSEGRIVRVTNPVRYGSASTRGAQAALPFYDAELDEI